MLHIPESLKKAGNIIEIGGKTLYDGTGGNAKADPSSESPSTVSGRDTTTPERAKEVAKQHARPPQQQEEQKRESRGQSLTRLRRSIIGKESNQDPSAVNPHSGALGYGQVMPSNVKSWTREAIGKEVTPENYLASPQVQLATIDHRLGKYYDEEMKNTGGDQELAVRRVASRWYSGQGDLYNNTNPQKYGGASYPSIDSYTKDIWRRFNGG